MPTSNILLICRRAHILCMKLNSQIWEKHTNGDSEATNYLDLEAKIFSPKGTSETRMTLLSHLMCWFKVQDWSRYLDMRFGDHDFKLTFGHTICDHDFRFQIPNSPQKKKIWDSKLWFQIFLKYKTWPISLYFVKKTHNLKVCQKWPMLGMKRLLHHVKGL